jgi:hypothetical protein
MKTLKFRNNLISNVSNVVKKDIFPMTATRERMWKKSSKNYSKTQRIHI